MIRLPRLPAPVLRTLLDCATEEDARDNSVVEATFFEPSLDDLWREQRQVLLAAWIEEHPGTRPARWWALEAPRQPLGTWPGWYFDGRLELPRQRLGGTGTPAWEALAHGPCYRLGVPAVWITAHDVELYTGRAKDIHGRVQFSEWQSRPFAGVAVGPLDPPIHESQASYLKRFGLLLPGELRRIPPEDFEPEALDVNDDGE